MERDWQNRPGDWWLHTRRRPTYKKRTRRRPQEVVCSNCNARVQVGHFAVHQNSDRCRINRRERELEDRGYVRYRWGTQKIELTRLTVIVADRGAWVPRWAMIVVHSMRAWCGHSKHAWAYEEAFNAVAEDPDKQQLLERVALQRGRRALASPHMLLTLRTCDRVVQAALDRAPGFGERDFRTWMRRCYRLIEDFPEAPLSEHLILAVSATLSHKIIQAKIQQRSDQGILCKRQDPSATLLEEIVRKVGGHDVVRACM